MVTKVYYLYKPGMVIVIGPNQYPWYISQLASIILLISILAIAAFMLISLLSFHRSLKKLDLLAASYGEGNFDCPIKLNRFAAMYPLYNNLKSMGERINTLIRSHKDLTQAISHELKTPLARLKFALALSQEASTAEAANKALQEANIATHDLEHLINELLLYTRFDRQFFSLSTEQIELWQSLNEVLVDHKYEGSGKQLEVDIAPEIKSQKLLISERYFKILLENILSNAFRYAHSKVLVKAYLQQNKAFIEIADDGPGIPEAYREKVFEPLFSIDQSRNKELSGHGLGLAIVARIIDGHQGSIAIQQSPNLKGALFILSLPLA
jgi:signal transduction histidine kinase